MLIVHVCRFWYSHYVKVNYCFIVRGICYHFVKKETTMCGYMTLGCDSPTQCYTTTHLAVNTFNHGYKNQSVNDV